MKCEICGCGLGNSHLGKENHMKKYHAVTLEKPQYKPMDPKEKAEKIKRMEARLAGKVTLGDTGDLTGYGVLNVAPKPVEDVFSAIDDARLDLGHYNMPAEPVQAATEPNVEPEHPIEACTPACFEGQPELVVTPVMTQEEFEIRLEKLYQQSEAFHKDFMAKFGPKE